MSENQKDRAAVLREAVSAFVGRRRTVLADLAAVLQDVLSRVRDEHAPTAIVETRLKDVESFAEKCLRKGYADPLTQMTDQCAGRLICPTLCEKERVAETLRTLFAPVDEYEDTVGRHDTDAFGYLGIHILVHFSESAVRRMQTRWPDLALPAELLQDGLKCEIQIRTSLEHAHADIMHDRLYKVGFEVPPRLRRMSAEVAAILEAADSQLQNFVDSVNDYSFGAPTNMDAKSREDEIARLQTLLEQDADALRHEAVLLRLVRIHRATWQWQKIIDLIAPLADNPALMSELRGELGYAVFRKARQEKSWSGMNDARDILERADKDARTVCERKARHPDLLSRGLICFWLGQVYACLPGKQKEAITRFETARRLRPSDPYVLVALIEKFTKGKRPTALELALLDDAARACHRLVDAGIEPEKALIELAKIHFLRGDADQAFTGLALAARHSVQPEPFQTAQEDFLRFCDLPEVDWELADHLQKVADLLAQAKTRSQTDSEASIGFPPVEAVIVSGTTAAEDWELSPADEAALVGAFAGFDGLVLSGGSTGRVCLTAKKCAEAGAGQFWGFLPADKPAMPGLDEAQVRRTDGADYSIAEPILMWQELFARGIAPGNVALLCLGGGRISFQEVMLAVGLGAQVYFRRDGRKEGASQMLDSVLEQNDSACLGNLHLLPVDTATLAMFRPWLSSTNDELSDDVDKLAQQIHANYLRDNAPRVSVSNCVPWPDLRADFKQSNRHQASNSIRILTLCGFTVRRLADGETAPEPVVLNGAEIETLSELEHGRWNMERLMQGWRFGKKKDADRRLSPCLVPWRELPDNIRDYDRRAVREWPALLMSIGLVVERTAT